MAAQAAHSQAKHSVARPSNDPGAVHDLPAQHHAGAVAAGRPGVSWVHAQHIQHIPEVDAYSLGSHQNLIASQLYAGVHWQCCQAVQAATGLGEEVVWPQLLHRC
jgi:hypothetical protein